MDSNTQHVEALSQMGSTFAERAKARAAAEKAVKPAEVENKSVGSATTKARKPRAVKKD